MASIIKLKRNTSAGQVPSNGALEQGELAINLADKKLFSSSNGTDVIQISGDAYAIGTVTDTDGATIKLTGTGNAANTNVVLTGANGIGITSNDSGAITITANTVDVDFGTSANVSSANLSVATGANTDVVKIVGDDHIVVAGTNTSHISVKLTNAVSVASVQTSGNTVVGGDADIAGEVNAASAAIVGAATVGTTLGVTGVITAGNDVDITGEVNAASAAIVGAATVGTTLGVTGVITAGNDVDITGEVNAASAAIVGAATVGTTLGVTGVGTFGNDVDITGEVNAASAAIVGAATVGTTLGVTGVITAGSDVDITGEVNAASAAITGAATVGGQLTVSGNLVVSGTTTTVSSTTVEINDNLIKLAANQTGTDDDLVDTGLYMTFDDSDTQKYSGLFRDKSNSNKAFVFVEGITGEPGNEVSYSASNLAYIEAIIDGGTY